MNKTPISSTVVNSDGLLENSDTHHMVDDEIDPAELHKAAERNVEEQLKLAHIHQLLHSLV